MSVKVEDFKDYGNFVANLASEKSTKDFESKLGTVSLGLAGEAAEIAEIVNVIHVYGWSKACRDNLIKELGDLMWYIAFGGKFITNQTQQNEFILNVPLYVSSGEDPYKNMKTASVNLCIHAGKFSDKVKKLLYHGIEFSENDRQELRIHLSNIYHCACFFANSGMGCDIWEVVQKNVEKLTTRYRNLRFSTGESIKKVDEV